VKFANFQLLRESIAHHQAVLIESGFLCNYEEEIWLSNPENINYLASLILVAN
jgi:N-acetylmuramoyl-L-alanine amidase